MLFEVDKLEWKLVPRTSKLYKGRLIPYLSRRVYTLDGKASWPRLEFTIYDYNKSCEFAIASKLKPGTYWDTITIIPKDLVSDVVEMWHEAMQQLHRG